MRVSQCLAVAHLKRCMRKSLLVFALIGLSGTATYAQGTIRFYNNVLARLQYQEVPGGPITTAVPAGAHVAAYWSADDGGAAALVGAGRGTLAGPTSLTQAGGLWPAGGSLRGILPTLSTARRKGNVSG